MTKNTLIPTTVIAASLLLNFLPVELFGKGYQWKESKGLHADLLIDGKKVEDNIPEDQSLIINTKKGLVLLSGCGHAGIVNTLEYASKLFGNKSDIYTALGGFHLFNKNDNDIDWTAKYMRKYKVKYFLGAHCTGINAVYSIREKNKMNRSD